MRAFLSAAIASVLAIAPLSASAFSESDCKYTGMVVETAYLKIAEGVLSREEVFDQALADLPQVVEDPHLRKSTTVLLNHSFFETDIQLEDLTTDEVEVMRDIVVTNCLEGTVYTKASLANP